MALRILTAAAVAWLAAASVWASPGQRSVWSGVYTEVQADQGAVLFKTHCVSCHGESLGGGEQVPALRGVSFGATWEGVPISDLFERMRKTMPPGKSWRGHATGAREHPGVLAEDERHAGWKHRARERPGGAGVHHVSEQQTLRAELEMRRYIILACVTILVAVASIATLVGARTANGEWPTYGGTLASTRYSPLDQINASNFSKLEVAWRLKTDIFGPKPDFLFQATPLMVGGVVYSTAGARRAVVALDAGTGELLWAHTEHEGPRGDAAPRLGAGRGPRVLGQRQRRPHPVRHARLPAGGAQCEDRACPLPASASTASSISSSTTIRRSILSPEKSD